MRIEDFATVEREFLRFLVERLPPPEYHLEDWPSLCEEARSRGVSMTDEEMDRVFGLFLGANLIMGARYVSTDNDVAVEDTSLGAVALREYDQRTSRLHESQAATGIFSRAKGASAKVVIWAGGTFLSGFLGASGGYVFATLTGLFETSIGSLVGFGAGVAGFGTVMAGWLAKSG